MNFGRTILWWGALIFIGVALAAEPRDAGAGGPSKIYLGQGWDETLKCLKEQNLTLKEPGLSEFRRKDLDSYGVMIDEDVELVLYVLHEEQTVAEISVRFIPREVQNMDSCPTKTASNISFEGKESYSISFKRDLRTAAEKAEFARKLMEEILRKFE